MGVRGWSASPRARACACVWGGGGGVAGAGAPGDGSAHLAAGARLRLIRSHCPQRGKARGFPCLWATAGRGGDVGARGRSTWK